jgi:hypothetical protein
MCQKSKERIKKMQAEGIPTPHDPKEKPEDVGKSEEERIKKMQAEGIPTPHDPKEKPEDVGKSEGYSILFMS